MKKHSLSPLVGVGALYLLCFAFRLAEYFVLHTDRTLLGEALFHKLAGIALLCLAAKRLSYRAESLGFARAHRRRPLLHGLLLGAAAFALAYGVELALCAAQGASASLRVYVTAYAPDGNLGYQTALPFFLLCIAGNIVNVVMEEGVFRGLFPQMLCKHCSFAQSTAVCACLFGLWHIAAPLRSWYEGTSDFAGFLSGAALLTLSSALVGVKFALLTRMTGSLYMAMGDHFVNNTVVNLLHVVTEGGADAMQFVRVGLAQGVSFLVVAVWYRQKWCRERKETVSIS